MWARGQESNAPDYWIEYDSEINLFGVFFNYLGVLINLFGLKRLIKWGNAFGFKREMG